MKLSENDYQILQLTDAFYEAYPNPPYIELLKKRKRAYNCLLFESNYNYFICIPFRSEISHPYAYHFKYSIRSRRNKSGLDYTKIVIITKTKYMKDKNAIIDRDEFKETIIQLERIKREALKYVEDYVEHMNGKMILHMAEYKRKYGFSTLKYFHKELGIRKENEKWM